MQLCIFLKALLGEEAMERLMNEGIAVAKREIEGANSQNAQAAIPVEVDVPYVQLGEDI
jgi:hypothetical protein